MILTKVRRFAQVPAGAMSEFRSHQTKCVVEEKIEEQENENNDYMVRDVVGAKDFGLTFKNTTDFYI
jgi:hypothetical protein